jgi:hypothetical protein
LVLAAAYLEMPMAELSVDARGAMAADDDVRRILGDIDERAALEILELRATVAEIEEVAVRAAGDGDALGRANRPLTGVAAEILEMPTEDEEEPPPIR